MNSIREFICYNQKEIIRFEYTISQLHKSFKESFLKKSFDVEAKYSDLIVESFMLMEKIFSKNLEFIKNTYGMYDENIRVTIKMVENDEVIDIFRSHYNEDLIFSSAKIEENTGFKYILSGKDIYYLNDDIEESFIKGEYQNPRLDNSLREKLIKKEISWKNCWKQYKDNINDYYNSTLIIPMSITTDNENKDTIFYRNFFEKNDNSKLNTKERIIWGFFCLDSKQKNFFTNISTFDPIDLGFIITDILSLYLIFFYNYTSASETVNKYLKEIE